MNIHSVDLQNRIEAIKRKNEQDAEAKYNKMRDIYLTWKAEVCLVFENVDFIKELISCNYESKYDYVYNKLMSHKLPHKYTNDEIQYKMEYILNKIKSINIPDDEQKIREIVYKNEQKNINEMSFDENRIRRQKLLDQWYGI